MRRLRSTWGLRLITSILVVGSLLLAVLPTVQAAGRTAVSFYSGWLRTQIAGPSSESVEQALRVAAASEPQSFDEFLAAFISAFEAQNPSRDISDVFSRSGLSREALLRQLEGRFHQIMEHGIPPYATLAAGQSPSNTLVSKSGMPLAGVGCKDDAPPLPDPVPYLSNPEGNERLFVRPIRTLWAALPLGP